MIALASKRKEKAVDSSPAYAIREGSQEMTDSALVAASKIVVTVRRKALHRRHLEEQGLEAKASGVTKTKTDQEPDSFCISRTKHNPNISASRTVLDEWRPSYDIPGPRPAYAWTIDGRK